MSRAQNMTALRGPETAGDFRRVAASDNFAEYKHPDGTEVRVWRNKHGWHSKVEWQNGIRRQDFPDTERGLRNALFWAADLMEEY